MPSFRYTAVSASGEMQQGVMDAPDEASVIRALQRQGSVPMRAEPAAAGEGVGTRRGGLRFTVRTGLGRQAVTEMTRELAVMLGAGLDLDRALRFLEENAPNPRVGATLDRIRASVRDGGSLAAAPGAAAGELSRGLCRHGSRG